MKGPFEFAKRLLQYVRGELSGEIKDEVEALMREIKSLENLSEELKQPDLVERELRIIRNFNTENALNKIKAKERNYFLTRALKIVAAIVLLLGGTAILFFKQESLPRNRLVVERIEPGKNTAVLELASGITFGLDTIVGLILNDQKESIFSNHTGLLKMRKQDSVISITDEDPVFHVIRVPYGGIYTVELSDGTKVYLNSGSVLEFPTRFNQSQRKVRLHGEAFFEIAENKKHPFVVEVDQLAVKVLGTSFNLKSYKDENGVYATLIKGKIAILLENQPEKILQVGEQAFFDREHKSLKINKVDVEPYISWKDGIFYFKSMTLEEILKIISRWYDLEVIYMHTDSKRLIYNGKLPMYTSVEQILCKFEMTEEVYFELNNRTLTVYEK